MRHIRIALSPAGDDYFVSGVNQPWNQEGADVTGAADDENSHYPANRSRAASCNGTGGPAGSARLASSRPRSRQRSRRKYVVQTHVVRELAVVIRQVHRVAEDHCRPRESPRIPTEGDSYRLAELRIIDLSDRLIAVGERFLEARHKLVLRPRRLHRIRGGGILRSAGCSHRAEVVAEEVIVARDVLSDKSDAQLRRRWFVAELRLGDRVESLRDVAMQGRDPVAKCGGDRIGGRCCGRLLGGEADRGQQRQNREMTEFHTYPPGMAKDRYSARGSGIPQSFQRLPYSSCRRHQKPFSLRPLGARSSH